MSLRRFDLGLCDEDVRAMRAARREALPIDTEAALRLIADATPLVDAEVRRRPLLRGAPFTLPGHQEPSLA